MRNGAASRARPESGREPHVVVDARMAGDSGVGTYLRNLLPRVVARRPSWRFTMLGRASRLGPLAWPGGATVSIRECTSRIYTVTEQLELLAKRPFKPDVFWSPHYNIPLVHAGRLMVTVHDVAHLAVPEFAAGFGKQLYARAMFGAVRRRADLIVCDSAFTRDEFLRLVGAGRGEMTVVHLGVDVAWRQRDAGPSPRARPYAVYVGNVKPQKNLGVLLRAFARIQGSVPHDLVIVGRREGMRSVDSSVDALARTLGDRVELTGEVAFDRLRAYVAYADALIAPSLYEGFGLPPLEAMAAGCPCLVSRIGAHSEMCGDAALYCDPRDPDDVARELQRLLLEPELGDALRRRGIARVESFSWDQCAEGTVDAMERTLAQ